MKRVILIGVVLALMLLPTSAAFAQTQPPSPPECNPELFLNEIVTRFSLISDFEDLGEIVIYIADTTSVCLETWLTMLFGPGIFEMLPPELFPPTMQGGDFGGGAAAPGDPNDGIMTPEEAEFVLITALNGDIATANEYICLAEQLNPDDVPPGDITIDRVKCAAVEDTITCTFEGTLAGEYINEETTFEIVNGKLCGNE